MLTDKEKRWLEFRKDVCFRCKKRRQTCSLQLRDDCRKAGYPIRDLAMVIPPDYRDAAEFEARVSRRLAVMLYMFQGLTALKLPPPTPDWFLKQARLTEEAAMEREENDV